MNVTTKTLSSLEKVFPDTEPTQEIGSAEMLKNARYNYTLAFCMEGSDSGLKDCALKISGIPKRHIQTRVVQCVPANYVINPYNRDGYVLSDKAGLFPDVLAPIESGITLPPCKWESVVVSISGQDIPIKAGRYTVKAELQSGGAVVAKSALKLRVIDAELPSNPLKITQWIHYDCICRAHAVKPFSDRFYRVFKEYLDLAVKNGQTMLLTPLFTFPLDTAIGGERDTFQLVDVTKSADSYTFNLDRLKRFIEFALSRGIRFIEFSHLFTQWGGEHAPKIMATEDGALKRIFGWETDSLGAEYTAFLHAFLPELVRLTQKMGIEERCYFHLTDEPQEGHLERYGKLSAIIRQHIGKMKVMDAMSDHKFYDEGLVDIPVAATNHAADFLSRGINAWVYYCCVQATNNLSNRFLCFPNLRNRIFGAQLYYNNVDGFLQWGFNFYNTSRSTRAINPYAVTDADRHWPAGDAFVVYPHGSGALSSIRLETFYDGIQDYLALKLLERKTSRKHVLSRLKQQGIEGFTEYSHDERAHIAFMQSVYAEIEALA